MQAQGLYHPKYEHDNCGVGFVADVKGRKSHDIVRDALTVLKNLIHRGAVGGDGKTGDGAGLLTQIPHELFLQYFYEAGVFLPGCGYYAVGMLFMPQDKKLKAEIYQTIEALVQKADLTMTHCRVVPVDTTVLGEVALDSLPSIEQIFIDGDEAFGDEFERRLYVLRKQIEAAIAAKGIGLEEFCITSLSSRTVVYKGMLVGAQVGSFYKDLQNPDYRTAVALIHQRYSTNTFPSWALAQPFRYMAHNGEINTIRGNIKKMSVREQSMESPLFEDLSALFPVIQKGNSDSGSFDNLFELLVQSGRSMEHSMMMMVPEPFGDEFQISRDKRDFYLYHSSLMEPWDGPAALVFTDGRRVGATLDRNGLRPARYTITKSGKVVLGSEAGILEIPPSDVLKKGHLKPGRMFVIDLENGRIVPDQETKSKISRSKPYRRWLSSEVIGLKGLFHKGTTPKFDEEKLHFWHLLFGYSDEDLAIIKKMAEKAQEPVGSMGNDTQLPFLSEKPQRLSRFFRQNFAQVTNPPIDPYRENMVMSLMSFIGREGNLLEESAIRCRQLKLPHPILSNEDMHRLKNADLETLPVTTVSIVMYPNESLEEGLFRVVTNVAKAVDAGSNIIVLSDREAGGEIRPIPALLALSAVNVASVERGIRHLFGLVVETGEPMDTHDLALLVGYGASAVNPYAVMATISQIVEESDYERASDGVDNYVAAMKKGLMKIMSKMGVSTIRSYRGAGLFSTIGLDMELVDTYFPETPAYIGGYGLRELEGEIAARMELSEIRGEELSAGGRYSFKREGDLHSLAPKSTALLRKALANDDYELYKEFTELFNSKETPMTIRSLFEIKKSDEPILLDEVESEESIISRFVSGAMSLGSISPEVHATIAEAFNALGAMSNCGEGGVIPERDGTEADSKIRQVASGRFGVTPDYLIKAEEIQIKIAQGAKPGEGGQLPGNKVTPLIAEVRGSTAGVTLISPPPHHDIYSIEDLAQLIYDLRSVNQDAKISVKLVAESGVGTVAAGVVKAGADSIIISGHDGGTGASPLTSIFGAGLPWEIGLAETQQTLLLNGFRKSVELQTDGKLFTGRDIIVAALLGADRYGFGTALLIAVGCVMCRNCHKNNCSVGIATQDPACMEKYKGSREAVMAYIRFVARDVREWLVAMGKRSIDEVIGCTYLLAADEALLEAKGLSVGLDTLLYHPDVVNDTVRVNRVHGDAELIRRLAPALDTESPMEIESRICNRERSVGAALSSEVIRRHGTTLAPKTLVCIFKGYSGQSFGAFLAPGILFKLYGEANDYLGKGMHGGEIVVTPGEGSMFRAHDSVIAGNVALFGATGGEVFINGVAGERFAVRNSGASAVVCGVGNHGCEYMTGGTIVVLGRTGINFAAGMSGGVAYVLDKDELFDTRCNLELVDLEPVLDEADQEELHGLIKRHSDYTGSSISTRIIEDWEEMLPQFVKVIPVEYRKALERMEQAHFTESDTVSVTEEVV